MLSDGRSQGQRGTRQDHSQARCGGCGSIHSVSPKWRAERRQEKAWGARRQSVGIRSERLKRENRPSP